MMWGRSFRIAALALLLAACSTPRVPFTAEEQASARVVGIPDARFWADAGPEAVRARAQKVASSEALRTSRSFDVLALSGGASGGAFGAGLLVGWSDTGTRPEFTVVSGVSVGALIAPFAFLGPDYDPVLRAVFAEGAAEALIQLDALRGLFGSGLFRPEPLRNLIARFVDDRVLASVAAEHARGRRLVVLTTNLDAQRAVIWNMGAIASSGHPRALELFRSILAASASVPGVLPPVLVDVEAFGRQFAEMHVDGGVTANVLVVPESFLLSQRRLFPSSFPGRMFIVMNNAIEPDFEMVENRTLPVIVRSYSTTIKANTAKVLKAAEAFARRHRFDFKLAYIPADYPAPAAMQFDTEYMKRLFDYAYRSQTKGAGWKRRLPFRDAPPDGPRPPAYSLVNDAGPRRFSMNLP